MGSMIKKFVEAIAVAATDDKFRSKHPMYKKMVRETLYDALIAFGYRWDIPSQHWYLLSIAQEGKAQTPAIEITDPDPVSNAFLVRIMAPRQTISKINAEFVELCEALGWSVSSADKDYPNEPDGKWVRRYYRVTRGE